ncbi:scm-like with four MBT domains protein 2 isoform X1 [Tachysurus ichikawai]
MLMERQKVDKIEKYKIMDNGKACFSSKLGQPCFNREKYKNTCFILYSQQGAIKEKYSDWTEFLVKELTGSRTAPANLLEGPLRGKNTVDLMVPGCVLEIRDASEPFVYWAVRVQRNVGGRLWLSYVGLEEPAFNIWIFYLDVRLRPLGWAKENCLKMEPPKELRDLRSTTEWIEAIETATSEALDRPLPLEVFKDHVDLRKHSFKTGMKLEMISPQEPFHICPVSVTKVLTMLINSAYKPSRVLRELQLVVDPQWNCLEETLKAKYKRKSYRASVRIVSLAEQVTDFCRRVCTRLQCCPNLFGPTLISEKCPENCSTHTKTKYTHYYGKKRKVGRPSLGECTKDGDAVKPARRRKKRKAVFVQRKRRSTVTGYHAMESAQDSDDFDDFEEEEESFSGESSSLELREDAPVSFSTRRGRPCRSLTLPGTETSTERQSLRRSTRTHSYTHNQAAKNTHTKTTHAEEEESRLVLEKNPLEWSVSDVVNFIMSTDCASLAKIFQDQDIDGQALLLLTLPTVQECMDLKLGPAIKLCHQIERVKVAFYSQYAN